MKKLSLIILLFACLSTYASTGSSESPYMSCDASTTKSCQMRFDDMVIYGTGKVVGKL